ncbi:MAG: transglycosylase family protein [Acidimicrobiales bacterium]
MRRFLFALLLAPINVVTSHAPSTTAPSPPATTVELAARTTPRAPAIRIRHANIQTVLTMRELRASALRLRVSVNQLRAMWQRVAICEVAGNWSMVGSVYSGIGFLNSTWSHYGGTRYAPLAGLATRDEQILIGMQVTGGYVPDQYGCSPVGW